MHPLKDVLPEPDYQTIFVCIDVSMLLWFIDDVAAFGSTVQ